MGRRGDYRMALRPLDPAERLSFLRDNSGLPGPRGNLELVEAIVDEGDPPFFDLLIRTDEEYLVVCGTVGLGRRLAEGANGTVERRLRILATDDRWRVREGVAMALQRLGDADPVRLHELVDDWATDPHPLVQRAALAGLCEPRLLRTEDSAAHALELCQRVTDALSVRPVSERRDESVRTLRQALGYCWSVAVAADPETGLPLFRELAQRSGDRPVGEPGETRAPGEPGEPGAPAGTERAGETAGQVAGRQAGTGEPGDSVATGAPDRVLDRDDPDVRWIVRENLKKARLARLLGPR